MTLGGFFFFYILVVIRTGLDAVESSFIDITIIVLLVGRILSIHSILMMANGVATVTLISIKVGS